MLGVCLRYAWGMLGVYLGYFVLYFLFLCSISSLNLLALLGLGLIKINTVLANFYNPRPSLILND